MFNLNHPNNVRLFPSMEAALLEFPVQEEGSPFTYKIVYSRSYDSYIIGQYQSGMLTGYLEK